MYIHVELQTANIASLEIWSATLKFPSTPNCVLLSDPDSTPLSSLPIYSWNSCGNIQLYEWKRASIVNLRRWSSKWSSVHLHTCRCMKTFQGFSGFVMPYLLVPLWWLFWGGGDDGELVQSRLAHFALCFCLLMRKNAKHLSSTFLALWLVRRKCESLLYTSKRNVSNQVHMFENHHVHAYTRIMYFSLPTQCICMYLQWSVEVPCYD